MIPKLLELFRDAMAEAFVGCRYDEIESDAARKGVDNAAEAAFNAVENYNQQSFEAPQFIESTLPQYPENIRERAVWLVSGTTGIYATPQGMIDAARQVEAYISEGDKDGE